MSRQHAHVSAHVPAAITVGRGLGPSVVFASAAAELSHAGYRSCRRENDVWRTDTVAPRHPRPLDTSGDEVLLE
jgi:RNA:NAD 2'-phosphotransferase (TPT1/KptA family)